MTATSPEPKRNRKESTMSEEDKSPSPEVVAERRRIATLTSRVVDEMCEMRAQLPEGSKAREVLAKMAARMAELSQAIRSGQA